MLVNHLLKRRIRGWLFVMIVPLLLVMPAIAQNEATQSGELSEMQLISRVSELQEQLASSQVADRDVAEQELLKLGVAVLDHLEPLADDASSDVIERVNRVRMKLEKIAVAAVTEPSLVLLDGSMTVDDALKKIRQQSGNDVALSGEVPDQFGEQKFQFKFRQKTEFWTVMADVMEQASLVVDPYAGEPGQLRLTPSQSARMAAANPGVEIDDPDKRADETTRPHEISGVFDLMVTRVTASRNLLNPELDYCNIVVQVRWEPRLQPISIDLPVDSIRAIDEFDKPIAVGDEEAVMHGVVQPEIPELEFTIPIGLVDRQIEVIKTLDATLDAVLPGRQETFRFKNIGKLDPGTEQRKAGALVTFDGVRKNDDLFGVTVRLSFDEAENALESHQGWAFNNPLFLEDAAGKKFKPVALETIRQDNEEVVIQYYFKEDPAAMNLVYKTSAAIVRVPVKITLKNIPLP